MWYCGQQRLLGTSVSGLRIADIFKHVLDSIVFIIPIIIILKQSLILSAYYSMSVFELLTFANMF